MVVSHLISLGSGVVIVDLSKQNLGSRHYPQGKLHLPPWSSAFQWVLITWTRHNGVGAKHSLFMAFIHDQRSKRQEIKNIMAQFLCDLCNRLLPELESPMLITSFAALPHYWLLCSGHISILSSLIPCLVILVLLKSPASLSYSHHGNPAIGPEEVCGWGGVGWGLSLHAAAISPPSPSLLLPKVCVLFAPSSFQL